MNEDRFEKIEIRAANELWSWLSINQARTESIWLVTWKAAQRDKYVSREDVLDALIAYGWFLRQGRKVTAAVRRHKVRKPCGLQHGNAVAPFVEMPGHFKPAARADPRITGPETQGTGLRNGGRFAGHSASARGPWV